MSDRPRRYLVALALLLCVFGIAWGFAGIEGELRLRDEGVALNDADLALDAAAASRWHLGEALRVAAFGNPSSDEPRDAFAGVAVSRAQDELDEFERRVRAVTATDSDYLAAAAGDYLEASNAFIAAVQQGDLGTADFVFAGRLEPAYTDLSRELAAIRASHVTSFTRGDGFLSAVSVATRFLLAAAVPLLAILALLDASRRRQRQRELELELRAQHELSKTKDEFIANVSHELRTPLTIVSGFASVLEEDSSLPDHVGDAVSYIARESDELSRMVDDLLTAARADAGSLHMRLEQVPVREAIEAVATAGGNEDHLVQIDLETAYVHADAFRLRQVIRNLVSNARKHGGPSIRFTGRVEDNEYVLTVADDGPGVGRDIEPVIFDRFVHGPNERRLLGAVGLGLAVAKSLVDRMNGKITYRRAEGWTHFTVRLPLWSRARAQPTDSAANRDVAAP